MIEPKIRRILATRRAQYSFINSYRKTSYKRKKWKDDSVSEFSAGVDRLGTGEGKGRKGLLGGSKGSGEIEVSKGTSVIVFSPRCVRRNGKLKRSFTP